MPEEYSPTELERAYAALEEARSRRDPKAISAAHQEIRAIRERIHTLRRKLVSLATERIHLIGVVEQVRLQLLRYERHLEDHDQRMSRVREELLRMGGRIPETLSIAPDEGNRQER